MSRKIDHFITELCDETIVEMYEQTFHTYVR
jgi:hypothetical protein